MFTQGSLLTFEDLAKRLSMTELEIWAGVDNGTIPEPLKLDPVKTRKVVAQQLGVTEAAFEELQRRGEIPDMSQGAILGFDSLVIGRWEALGRPPVAQMKTAAQLAEALKPKLQAALRAMEQKGKLSQWLIRYAATQTPDAKLKMARRLFIESGLALPDDNELALLSSLLN